MLTGHHRRGIERHLQALALFHETADRGRIMTLSNLGEAFLAEGHPGQAHTRYAAALDLAKAAGDVFEQARAHDGLGRVHAAAGDCGQARQHWEQALTRYAELGVPEAGQVRARLAGSGVSSNETKPAARS